MAGFLESGDEHSGFHKSGKYLDQLTIIMFSKNDLHSSILHPEFCRLPDMSNELIRAKVV
jgi:hypothetical protein